MHLAKIIETVEAYERRLPYNIRYQVGQDGPLVWVRAWEWREVDGLAEPQRRIGEKVIVREVFGPYGPWVPENQVIEAAFEAAQQLMGVAE